LGRGEVCVEGRGETLVRSLGVAAGKPDRLPGRFRDGRDDSLGRRLDPGIVRGQAGQLVEARVDPVGSFDGSRIGVQCPGEHVEPAGAQGRGRGLQQGHQVAILGRHSRLRPGPARGDMGHAVEQPRQLGRDRRLLGELAARLGLPQQLGQPGPAPAEVRLLAGQVDIELAEDLPQLPAGVAGQYVANLVQAQAQFGEAPDAGQFNGIPQRVLAVAIRPPRRLGQQADVMVIPDGPGAGPDELGEFYDPHATRKHLDAATRSNGARRQRHARGVAVRARAQLSRRRDVMKSFGLFDGRPANMT
jgi:hypothetical protein